MAITKEQLEVKITVESKEAMQSLQELDKETKYIAESNKQLSDSYSKDLGNSQQQFVSNNKDVVDAINNQNSKLLEATSILNNISALFYDAASAMNTLNNTRALDNLSRKLSYISNLNMVKGFQPLKNVLQIASKSINSYNNYLVKLGITQEQINGSAIESVSVFGKIGNTVSAVNDKIFTITSTFNSIKQALDMFTNPTNVKRLNNILLIVGKFAGFKGYDRTATMIGEANNSLETYDQLLITSGLSEKSLGEQIDSVARKLEIFDNIILGTKVSVLSLASVFTILAIKNSDAIAIIGASFSEFKILFTSLTINIKNFGKEVIGIFKVFSGASDAYAATLVTAFDSDIKAISTAFKNNFNVMRKELDIFKVAFQNANAANFNSYKSFIVAIKSLDYEKIFTNISGMALTVLGLVKNTATTTFSIITSYFAKGNLGKEFGNVMKSIGMIFTTSNLGKNFADIFIDLKTIIISFKNITVDVFSSIVKSIPKTIEQFKNLGSTIGNVAKGGIDFAKILTTTHVRPGLIAVTEAANIFSGGIAALGFALINADSNIAKFIGGILLLAGTLLGSFSTIMNLILGTIGSVFSKIGNILEEKMSLFEEKFKKAEISVKNFEFTMKGFTREFGDSIGTAEEWNQVIQDISENTLVSAVDARKMATEIVQVGAGLELNKEQMFAFNKLITNYIKAGDDAYDVTVGFLQALTGMGQSVIKYGLHVSDAAVEHSNFGKKLDLNINKLTESEKVTARLATIMEQAAAVNGRASEQLNTVAGAQQYLNKQVEYAEALMGSQNFLVAKLNIAMADLMATFLDIPKPIWLFIGAMQDLGAVFFKVTGTILSYSLTIVSLTTLYKILTDVIIKFTVVQEVLTWTMNKFAVSLGVQAVAVTNLTSLFKNFGILAKGVLVSGVASLVAIFSKLIDLIVVGTGKILSNPLFWKGTAVAASIYFIYNALKDLNEKTKIFNDISKGITSIVDGIGSAFGSASDKASMFSFIIQKISSFFGGFIAVLLQGVYTIIDVFALLYKNISLSLGSSAEEITIFEDAINETMTKLSYYIGEQADNLFTLSSKASAANVPLEEQSKIIEDITANLSKYKSELVTSTEKAKIFAEVLGTPIESLMLSKNLAEENLSLAKTLEDKKKYSQELVKIDAEIIKAYRDTSKLATEKMSEITQAGLEQVKSESNIVKLYAMKLKADLKPFVDALSDMKFLPTTKDTFKVFDKINAAIRAITEKNKQDQIKAQSDLASSISAINMDLALEYASIKGKETDVIRIEAEKQRIIAMQSLAKQEIDYNQFNDKIRNIDLKELKDLEEIEKQKILLYKDAQDKVLNILGTETEKIRLEQENRLKEYKDLLDKKLIDDKQYFAIKAKLEADAAKEATKEAKKNSAGNIVNIIDSVKSGANSVIDLMASKLGVIGSLMASILKFFNQPPEEFKAFVDGLIDVFKKLPTYLFQNIPVLITALIEALPDLVLGAWVEATDKLYDKAPEIVMNIIKAIGRMLKSMGNITKVLRDTVVKSFKDAWAIIKNIFSGKDLFSGTSFSKSIKDSTTKAMSQFKKSISGSSEQLFGMKDISKEGGNKSAQEIAKAILISTITGVGWLKISWNALKATGKWLDSNIFTPAWEGMKQAGRWLDENIWGPAWEGIKQAGRWLDSNIFTPIIGAFKAVFMFLIDTLSWVFGLLNSIITEGAKLIVKAFELIPIIFKFIWDSFMSPFIDGIILVFQIIRDTIWKPFIDSIKAVFVFIWEGILKPFIDYIKAVFVFVWEGIFQPVVKLFKATFEFIKDLFTEGPIKAFSNLWDKLKDIFSDITDAFSNLWDKLSNIGTNIKEAFGNVWDKFKDIGGQIWAGVVKAFSLVGDYLGDIGTKIWKGIESALGSVASWFKDLFKFDGGGTGTVENFLGFDFPWLAFAEGGKVPGQAKVFGNSYRNDTVPALLSPGEIVIDRETANNPAMKKFLEVAQKQGEIPMYGFGSWLEKQVTNPINILLPGVGTVIDAISPGTSNKIAETVIPKEIQDLIDSIVKFIPNIDIANLLLHPIDTLMSTIKSSIGVFQPYFKKMMHFQEGGLVPGIGNSDSIPAMLTPGEFVLTRSQVQSLGFNALNRLSGNKQNGSQTINITLNIDTEQPIDESFVRNKLMPTIKSELKRASIDGKRILATSGVR